MPVLSSNSYDSLVSAINAYAGFGRSFAEGSVLLGSDPLPAPLDANGLVPFSPNQGVSAQDAAAMRQVSAKTAMAAQAAIQLVASVNERVDRLRVFLDPGEVARAGADQIATERRQEL